MPQFSKKGIHSIGLSAADKEQALLARLPKPITTIRKKGNEFIKSLLLEFFSKTDDILFDLAKNALQQADQDDFFSAMREIRGKQSAIEKGVVDRLDSAYAKLALPENSSDALQNTLRISSDDLALVSYDEIDELVAKESLAARAHAANHRALKELALRINSVILNEVDENTLPVCPKVLSDIFVAAVHTIDISTKAMMVVFKVYESDILNKLNLLYQLLNELLKERGILPQISPSSTRTSTKAHAPVSTNTGGLDSPLDPEFAPMPIAQSFSPFHSNAHPNASRLSSQVFGSPIQSGASQLDLALQNLVQHIHSAPHSSATQNLTHLINQFELRSGQSVNLSQDESSFVSVLDQLFGNLNVSIGQSDPVNELLAQLQIPVARMALHDQSFFSNRHHSARNLLNQLTTGLLQCDTHDADKLRQDPLFDKIQSLIQTISQLNNPSAKDFEKILRDFESFKSKENQRANLVEKRFLSSELGRFKNEEALSLIEHTIAEVCQGMELLQAVQDIIQSGWKMVMHFTALKYGVDSTEWDDCVQTLIDLVLGTQKHANVQEQASAERSHAHMKQRLKSGFDAIHFDLFKTENMLKSLDKAYADLCRIPSKPVKPVNIAAPTISVENIKETVEKQIHPTVKSADSVLKPFIDQARSLSRGAWFNLKQDDGTVRCRLAAIIENYEKYIFVSRVGTKICDKNLIEVAKMLQEQTLVFMDSNQVFEKALEQVVMSLKEGKRAAPNK